MGLPGGIELFSAGQPAPEAGTAVAGAGRPAGPGVPEGDREIWDAVRRLPRRQREAVALRYVADLPEAEIALAMGISRGAVSSSLAAAKKSLSVLLSETVPPSLNGGRP